MKVNTVPDRNHISQRRGRRLCRPMRRALHASTVPQTHGSIPRPRKVEPQTQKESLILNLAHFRAQCRTLIQNLSQKSMPFSPCHVKTPRHPVTKKRKVGARFITFSNFLPNPIPFRYPSRRCRKGRPCAHPRLQLSHLHESSEPDFRRMPGTPDIRLPATGHQRSGIPMLYCLPMSKPRRALGANI